MQGWSLLSKKDQIICKRSLCRAARLAAVAERDRPCVGYPGLVIPAWPRQQCSGHALSLCLFRLDLKHSLAPPFGITNVSSEVTHSVHFCCVLTASVLRPWSDLWMLSHQADVLWFLFPDQPGSQTCESWRLGNTASTLHISFFAQHHARTACNWPFQRKWGGDAAFETLLAPIYPLTRCAINCAFAGRISAAGRGETYYPNLTAADLFISWHSPHSLLEHYDVGKRWGNCT